MISLSTGFMNRGQPVLAIVAHTVELGARLDVRERRITRMNITMIPFPPAMLDSDLLPRIISALRILILIIACISLLVEALLRLLSRSFLVFVHLLLLVVVAALLVVVLVRLMVLVALIVITSHAHLPIF